MVILSLLLLLHSEPAMLVAQGDAAFLRIEYETAVVSYTEALRLAPDDPEILWKLARVHVCMGEVLEGNVAGEHFDAAERFARKAIATDPRCAEARTWLAGSLGYQALVAGIKEQVSLSAELVEHARVALALNPDNDAAYSILGSFYRALGKVSWVERRLASLLIGEIPDGGFPEAEEALLRAAALAPDVMRHHYELGVLYMDMERYPEARASLEQAATLPVRVGIDRPRLKKIHELLRRLP